MSKTPHQYYTEVIGRKFDEDGVYGCQCVDGFKHFCRTQLGLRLGSICNPTGYATSIWDNYESLGLNKYFDKVPANQLVDGDWTIWSMNAKSTKFSHVAMFRKDNGNGTGVFLGQNQLGHPEFTQVNIYYDGVRGGLRPKIYHNQPAPQPQPTNNKNYVNLPPTVDSWRFYNLNSQPIKKNAIGTLNPKKFGGLSYYVYRYLDNGTTVEIQTVQFGRVKIYIKDTPATITVGSYKYQAGNH